MDFSAQQIAELLGGTVDGNPDAIVNRLAKIEEGTKGSISFLSNMAYAKYAYESDSSVIIVDQTFVLEKPIKDTCTLIRVDDARLAFTKLIEAYHQYKTQKVGISDKAYISESAVIGDNVYIAPGVNISEGVTIGNNTKIYANSSIGSNTSIGENTTIYSGCQIGDECIIGNGCVFQSGAVIGSDGFGFAPNSENKYEKIIHLGNVVIENNVEIGANTVVDRATLGSTIIREGVKLDNLIQIAHNVEIGKNTVIAAQSGIAGSSKIGKNCMIGGQVGIIGHLNIAEGVKIAAQSGIGQDVIDNGEVMQGSPAFKIGEYKRSYVLFKNLPKIKNQINQLEKELSTVKLNSNE